MKQEDVGAIHREGRVFGRSAAALTLVAAALVKVFLYDLAELDEIYRVLSFVALGLLLLAGAFAYQRVRHTAGDSE